MVPDSTGNRLLPSLRDWAGRAGFLGLSAGVMLFGYQAGFVQMHLKLDFLVGVLAIAIIQAEFALVSFAAFMFGSAAVFFGWSVRDSPYQPLYDDGTITAIVPVYRDADVLERSVESLLASAYEDLEVVVVCERDDGPAKRKAAALAEEFPSVSRLVNTGDPGSKAGAINYAVEQTESAYVGVFDADEVVHESFLPQAVGKLTDHDVVQGRTVPEPTGTIESIAYYESVLLSYVARRVLYVFTGFRMAASRAVLMDREALEDLGGYDTDMLTEDFYFAYQCYEGHLDVAELLDYPSRIEAAHNVTDWWGQRKRWMTGYAQVFHRLLTSFWRPSSYRDVVSVVICASTVWGSLMMLAILAKFPVLAVVGSEELFVLPFLAVFSITLAGHVHDYRRGLVPAPTWRWLLVPLIFPFYSLTAIKAVFEYVFSWSGEWYRVAKEA